MIRITSGKMQFFNFDMKKLFLLTMLFVLIIPSVFAMQGHMKLLAVRETENGYEGGIADLYLEIKPGSGRVFLETFPLTRTDTQMSTRFAKAIACDLLEKDCDDVDFFYTITADSAIIAGPSAGASIAVLTVAMLENLEFKDNYAITGTINSGGLVGPVGGLKAKVEAAKKAGMKKVLIPAGEIVVKVDNITTNLKNLSTQLNIGIEEISTLSEAVEQFTGKRFNYKYNSINIDEEYSNTMKSLAKQLCDRSNKLKSEIIILNNSINISAIKENALNLTTKGKEAFERQTFYSSASYCFGANVEYSTMLFLTKNLTKEEVMEEFKRLNKEINIFQNKVEKQEKKTITDLEAYIAIIERLSEAEESANEALSILNNTNKTERISRMLAYSSERINSANSWANFLGKSGKTFNLNKDVLKKSCQNKISEADERKQYVELYFPSTLDNVKKEIDKANAELEKGNYELCLSMASKAKAEVDIVLSVFGVDREQYQNIVDRKLEIVRNNIAREATKGIFPILGYSYYEYANSLKKSDLISSLLYSEYALELGNLDIYFKENKAKKISPQVDKKLIGIFTIGALVGFLASLTVTRRKKIKNFLLIIVLLSTGCSYKLLKGTANVIPNETTENPEVYFCPKTDCGKILEEFIQSANYSVHCALYDINLKNVISSLSKGSKTIDVKIVMDNSNYEDQIKGDGVRYDTDKQLMHNKFCVIDEHIVVSGSFNPTYNDNFYNNNNVVVIYSNIIAKNYADEFNELWNGEFGRGKTVSYPIVYVNGIKIENYFCPEDCSLELSSSIDKDKALYKIIDLIKKAETSIQVASFTFTNEKIADELIKAQARGINVTVVIENRQRNVMGSQYQRVKDFGLNIRLDGNKYNMHHKFMVIDNKIVITGSPNFTLAGFNKNDENMLIIYDERIVLKYVDEFNRLYNEGKVV